MFLSHYLGVYISEVSYWRPLTFQLGGDAMGNAPTFLLAIDMNLSQFQDFVCQNAFASGTPPGPRWGAYSAPQTPSWKPLGQAKMTPPPLRNPGYGPEDDQKFPTKASRWPIFDNGKIHCRPTSYAYSRRRTVFIKE